MIAANYFARDTEDAKIPLVGEVSLGATETAKSPMTLPPVATWRTWLLCLAWPLVWLAGVWVIHFVATNSGSLPPAWYETLCNVLWMIDIAFFIARRASLRERKP